MMEERVLEVLNKLGELLEKVAEFIKLQREINKIWSSTFSIPTPNEYGDFCHQIGEYWVIPTESNTRIAAAIASGILEKIYDAEMCLSFSKDRAIIDIKGKNSFDQLIAVTYYTDELRLLDVIELAHNLETIYKLLETVSNRNEVMSKAVDIIKKVEGILKVALK